MTSRKPQEEGSMKVSIDGKKQEVRVKTSGSTAGETMRMEFNPKKKHDYKLCRKSGLLCQATGDNEGVDCRQQRDRHPERLQKAWG